MMTTAAISTSLLYVIGVPVVIAALTGAIAALYGRLGAAADRRRDHYAQAVKTLVAWIEFPYRVRRRTDDDAATLHELAELGHDLQERLASHQAWMAGEKPAMAAKYLEIRDSVTALVGAAITQAWNTGPVTNPAGMVLGAWGPAVACQPLLADLQSQIERRFGIHRLRWWGW